MPPSARPGVKAYCLAAFLLPGLLAGCSPGQPLILRSGLEDIAFQTVGSYDAAGHTAALRRNRMTSAYEIDVLGTNGRVPLPGYTQARILGVYDAGRDRVSVVEGSTPGCPVRYTAVALDSRSAAWAPIGRCGARYRFSSNGREVEAVQEDAADPEIWVYRDRRIGGPVLTSSLDRAHARLMRIPMGAAPRRDFRIGRAPEVRSAGSAELGPVGEGAVPRPVPEKAAPSVGVPTMKIF